MNAINKAIQVAKKSTFRYQIGAVLLKHGKVLSTGFNSMRHQSKFKTTHYEGSYHAEVSCILNAIRASSVESLKGCTMVVVRVRNSGELGLALPCKSCYDIIQKMGIKKVLFSTNDGFSEVRI